MKPKRWKTLGAEFVLVHYFSFHSFRMREGSIPVGATMKRSNLRALLIGRGFAWHRCGTDSTSFDGPIGFARALVTAFPSSASMRMAASSCNASILRRRVSARRFRQRQGHALRHEL